MTKAKSKKQGFLNSRAKRKAFWQTRAGAAVEGSCALFLSYLLASLAINSGSLLQYFLAITMLIFGFYRLTRVFASRKKTA